MNLLPLCRRRQALQGGIAPARRFDRILVRGAWRVNESSEEKRSSGQAFPKMENRSDNRRV